MKVNIKQMVTGMMMPTKATKGSACFDAYLPESYVPLRSGEIRIVDLGFQVEVPEGYELQIRSRSGLASKGIMVANGVGCCDSDFRGNVGVILLNASQSIQPLNKDDRICQLKLALAPEFEWNEVDVVDCTERGEGGFGSTGISDADMEEIESHGIDMDDDLNEEDEIPDEVA
jgi:dUTP pyrophosphatase